MTGTVRSAALATSLAVLAGFVGCAGAPNGGPPPGAPNGASSHPSAPGDPSAAASTDGDASPTAKASDPKAWPFAPLPTPEQHKAVLERMSKDFGPIKSNWTPPGKSERYGHAEAIIEAPYEAVKARLVDYPHYKELAGPKFKKVNVVDKSAGKTDLYFQLPIMNGIVTIWYVTRFGPARPLPGGGDVIEGNFVKGNIKDMQIVFTLRPGWDAVTTMFVCDLNLALNIPAPQSNLDEELRDACGDAVNAIRTRLKQAPPQAP